MRTIIRLYKDKLHLLVAVAVLYALSAFCGLLMPYQMSKIIDGGIKEQNGDVLISSGLIMVLLAVVALTVSILSAKINTSVATRFEKQLRTDIFKKVNKLSFEQFSEVGTSGIITRITEDVDVIKNLATQGIYTLVNVPITFIGGVILVASNDWLIGIIMLCVSPIALLIAFLIVRKLDALWQRADEYTDEQNRHVRERLSGIRVLRAFDKEQEKHQKIAKATKEMVKSYIRSNVLGGLINPIASLILNIATVIILYVSASRIGYQSALTAGNIIASVQYIAIFLNGLITLSWSFAWLPHVGVCLKRINQVFLFKTTDENQENKDDEQKLLSGDLKIKDVSFTYPDSNVSVLKNINLEIKSGQKVALIGGTGSGKSTLVKLLLDFYDPTKGDIYLGNDNFKSAREKSVRKSISVALQKSTIFEGSVRYNIQSSESEKGDDEILRVALISELGEFLKQNGGLDYELKQSGSNLSGGQKQRINIARTILKDASVYVFDDSFSALDFLTESKLRTKLNDFLKDKTQLIITQRIATARSCDKIYVMDNGKIVGEGDHSTLMNSCDVYAELHRSQTGGAYEK